MSITFTDWWEAKEYARQQENLGRRTRIEQVAMFQWQVLIVSKGKPAAIPNREERSALQDIEEVARGIKPASLVWKTKSNIRKAKELGLVVKVRKDDPADIIIVKPEKIANAQKIQAIFAKYPLEKRGDNPEYHRELGRALGYSEEEIDFWNRSLELENG